jgi:hypothetical protein
MERSIVEGKSRALACPVEGRTLAEAISALHVEGGQGLNASPNLLKAKGPHMAFFERFKPSGKQVHRHIVMFLEFASKKTVSPELSPMKGA